MQLSNVNGTWATSDCHWDRAHKRAAKQGDIGKLHSLLYDDHHNQDDVVTCTEPVALPATRASRIDSLLASVRAVRAQNPDFVRKLTLGEATVDDAVEPDTAPEPVAAPKPTDLGIGNVDDLAQVLAANMSWYIEWPHIDRRFVAVYRTLAGIVGRNS
jgi:hypothetical protein